MLVLRKTVSEAERKAATLSTAPSGEGKGSTSKSVLELERVINAMKKVIGTCVHTYSMLNAVIVLSELCA